MINDHWDYIEKLSFAHGINIDIITICSFHYKAAFAHGFKHGLEAKIDNR
jgi:hypothetical protein